LVAYVIDTDCINSLLNLRLGRKVLRNCEIKLTTYMYEVELNPREQNKLKTYRPEIIKLEENDKIYAGKLIRKLNGKKEYEKWYLEGSHLRKIRHIGESEGAALARKLGIDIVLMEQKAKSIINNFFQHINPTPILIKNFGIRILEKIGSKADIDEYKKIIKERYRK